VRERPPGGRLAPRPEQIADHGSNGKHRAGKRPWSERES
jgi:hypothetical protein